MLSEQIKPISYLKSNAAEIIRTLGDKGQPLIITQNGEAKAVLQDIQSYERMQEAIALLKIVALGEQQFAEGKYESADVVFARIRESLRNGDAG